MRKIRGIAVVVVSFVCMAATVAAQAPDARVGRGGMGRPLDGDRGQRGLFRGITLSDAEKASLKAIHGKYAVEAKSARESLKPAMQEARAARQKGDTAAARAVWERNQAGRDRMVELRTRERTEIRAALSVEHQKQFDANVQQLAQRRAEWQKNGKAGKHGTHRGRVGHSG